MGKASDGYVDDDEDADDDGAIDGHENKDEYNDDKQSKTTRRKHI